jgi:L-alanine-DL-glutamate epimerase-like enolase superfamily enzyme
VHTALRRLERLAAAGCPVELVEQPVPAGDFQALAYLHAESAFPVAADESVSTVRDVERLADAGGVGSIIVKLAKSGGRWATRRVADAARMAGMRVLVSSMLEPLAALRPALALAAELAPDETHDLDSGLWFEGSETSYEAPYVQEAA